MKRKSTVRPKGQKRWKFLSLRQQNLERDKNAHQRRFDHPHDYRRLSEMLVALRKKRGLSQRKLADLLGVNHRTIVRWEKQSGYLPRPATMKKIKVLR